jgi:adenosine kinase
MLGALRLMLDAWNVYYIPMDIIVTGSLGFDYIMDFPGRFADRIMPEKIHSLSLSFLVDKLTKQFGGTAGNIAYSLNLLGTKPLILSAAGNDFTPYANHLRKQRIPLDHITTHRDVPTGSYFVVTDQEDNQIGSFYVGASRYNERLSIKSVKQKPRFVILAPNDPGAMKKFVAQCRSLRLPYLYDPAFQIASFTADELKTGIEGAAILIGNDYEIELIRQKLGVSHEQLVLMVPIVLTTIGSKGSIIETKQESIHIKPAAVKNTSDPTGAGDAYRAGFLAGYLRKFDLPTCGQMGSVAAAYTVETYGTQTHTFTKKEFCTRYEENFGAEVAL